MLRTFASNGLSPGIIWIQVPISNNHSACHLPELFSDSYCACVFCFVWSSIQQKQICDDINERRQLHIKLSLWSRQRLTRAFSMHHGVKHKKTLYCFDFLEINICFVLVYNFDLWLIIGFFSINLLQEYGLIRTALAVTFMDSKNLPNIFSSLYYNVLNINDTTK